MGAPELSIIYLYGFAGDGARTPEGGLLGVGDAEVEQLELDGFVAVIGRVDPGVYGGEALDENCQNVEWVAEQGLHHEQVVAWYVDHFGILPSSLLTLFSTEEALRAEARKDADRIRDTLERFDGLREWDLKVGHDVDALMDHLAEVSPRVAALDRQIEEASPGKRFLLNKKRADLARTEGREAARRLGRELLSDLEEHAADSVRLDPPDAESGVTVNAALLVARAAEDSLHAAFRERLTRLEELGVTASLTGPWAPYRFLRGHE